MTLQTSEALKKHESDLSTILFAKKPKSSDYGTEKRKYCLGSFSLPPSSVILLCTFMLFSRMMKGKKSSIFWLSLALLPGW